ncbi:FAD-dependent oxidoreductase [Endozoicomonas arenosclerae]|uniref:FAD-dependent oxidoreductase n=1 Tax=Endozoicomonas arenosclerae TaxID=1633495 RepID=UPI0007838C7E|nr:FAD-dependent oxidoreductase [Endozoicomonas arenosclerae]
MKYKNIAKAAACLLCLFCLSFRLWAGGSPAATRLSVVIVGGGPAAMTAAQTIARFNPNVSVQVIKSHRSKGQLEEAGNIENWPGSPLIKGSKLQSLMEDKASASSSVSIIEDHIVETDLKGVLKELRGENSVYFADIVILASGAEPNLPKNLEPHKGTGVFTCTDCDGPRFANKDVLVIGGGPSAIEQAVSLLSLNAQKVHLAVRGDHFKADETMIEHLYNVLNRSKNTLFLYYGHKLESVYLNQDGLLNASALRHKGGRLTLPVSGVFSATGQKPNSSIYPDVCLNEKSYVQRYDFNQNRWSHPEGKSRLLTLGTADSPFNTRLLAAAKGAASAQILHKAVTKNFRNEKRRVAVLGAGIGGKTAALYARRAGFEVYLFDPGNRKMLKSFWPVLKSEFSLHKGLSRQLQHLSVNIVLADSITVAKIGEQYHVQTGEFTVSVDAIIANTLEYSAESLDIENAVLEDLEKDYTWSNTCLDLVFTAGDVSEQPDLPRQAITAAYSGYLAGIRVLEALITLQNESMSE